MLWTPEATEWPTRNIAVNGDATAPSSPAPTPLINPLAPSFLALENGFVNIPVMPSAISETPPFIPMKTPSNTWSGFLSLFPLLPVTFLRLYWNLLCNSIETSCDFTDTVKAATDYIGHQGGHSFTHSTYKFGRTLQESFPWFIEELKHSTSQLIDQANWISY